MLDELSTNFTIDEYIKLIEDARKAISIPVIASIHCRTPRSWEEYATRLEAVGADAVEINLFDLDASSDRDGAQVERGYLDVARRVVRRVKIPVAAKLGFTVSSPSALVARLQEVGVAGVVLFNRFYGPDIDIERLRLTPSPILSSEAEALHALRWIGILSSQSAVDFAATGGVHSAETAIKLLLAGARAVEMCSALYIEGLEHIGRVTSELEAWMNRRKFQSLADFTASLNQDRSQKTRFYESAQYVDLQRSKR